MFQLGDSDEKVMCPVNWPSLVTDLDQTCSAYCACAGSEGCAVKVTSCNAGRERNEKLFGFKSKVTYATDGLRQKLLFL
jgi:hypothetical protein